MGSGAERRYQKGEPTSIRSSDARSRQSLAVIPQNLAKLKDLAELSPDRLLALTNRISVHRFAKRSLIYREGQLGDGLYIMLFGIAKLTCLNRKGERVLLEVLGPGDVVGIPSLMPDVRHQLRCEAFTDCRLGLLGVKELVEGVVGLPFGDFGVALRLTVGRWWRLLVRHANSMDQNLDERVGIALLDLGSKFGAQDERGTILNVRLTYQEIADLVDGQRKAVSICLKMLMREGALIQEGRRLIILPKQLQAILSPNYVPELRAHSILPAGDALRFRPHV
jgi:CRP/FNR family transcriptional regulator, cyclic AMP receptor protein